MPSGFSRSVSALSLPPVSIITNRAWPYHRKTNDYPRLGSVVGYTAIKSLAAGIAKAKSTDTEKLVAAFKGLELATPFGRIMFRPQDHQSTMGAYVGLTKNDHGKGTMVDYVYLD